MSAPSESKRGGSLDENITSEDFSLFQRFLQIARVIEARGVDEALRGSFDDSDRVRQPQLGSRPALITSTSRHEDFPDELIDSDDDESDDDEFQASASDHEFGKASEAAQNKRPAFSIPETELFVDDVGLSSSHGNAEMRTPAHAKASRHDGQPSAAQPTASRKRPHAAVEQRYRSGLNSKILQLHEAIPASGRFEPDLPHGPHDATQGMPSKSAVLDRAIQYTKHLIDTHQKYETQHDELRRLMQQMVDRAVPYEQSTEIV